MRFAAQELAVLEGRCTDVVDGEELRSLLAGRVDVDAGRIVREDLLELGKAGGETRSGPEDKAGGEDMKKIVRNMSTAESRNFWESAEQGSSEVQSWPAWKRAGINVAPLREEPREVSGPSNPVP